MRVNVYAEELTTDVRMQEEKVREETGRAYTGIRFFLHSSDRLHNTPKDDDRSAVTFWGNRKLLADLFRNAIKVLGEDPPQAKP
jgi:hypothetical protein